MQQQLDVGEMETMHSERRVVYFSDGMMVEGGDDEKDAPNNVAETVPPSRLKSTANKILAGIDYMGGGIAEFLGISTPRYASEMEYYKQDVIKNAQTDSIDNGNAIWLRSFEKSNNGEHSGAMASLP